MKTVEIVTFVAALSYALGGVAGAVTAKKPAPQHHIEKSDEDAEAGREYHKITLAQLDTTTHTHVEIEATVRKVILEGDGDWHVRLFDADTAGITQGVAEITPDYQAKLGRPRVGSRIRLRGISRFDGKHKWGEIHPVEYWEYVDPTAGK